MKLPAEKRIERAHVKLMQHKDFCLFSGVFMVGKVTICDKTRTACTNGRDVIYGRSFVDSLDDKQLAFLVVHEAMHKSYRHMSVWKHLPNKQVANSAMDYVINLEIQDTDPRGHEVAMPRDADGNLIGLLDEKYRGMDTKQVYDLLMKEGKGGKKGDKKGGSGTENGPSSPGDGQDDDGSSCRDGELDEHDWDGAGELTKEEVEELEREIDSALREGSILVGKMNGNVSRGVDEILHPKVNWKEALRDFIKVHVKGNDQSTWRRPNRRYLASNIIMPSAESHKAETILIASDTSGSIGGDMQAQFMGEMDLICKDVMPERIELLYWDSAVAGHETYAGADVANLINSTKPVGGGGTSPECVPIYMQEHRLYPQCVIMLTDGHFFGDNWAHWAKISAPVLWCVVGNKSFVPQVGQSVYVD